MKTIFRSSFLPLFALLLFQSIGGCLALSKLDDTSSFPFSLGVRDSLMIAHSFHGHPSFGPAGGLHGATYTCDVEFLAPHLHPTLNWVIDIGKALDVLNRVLQKYNLKNLDELFGHNVMTTTEFMCRQIHDDLCELLEKECPDFYGIVRVKLWESHKAWAAYTGNTLVGRDTDILGGPEDL
ncbi:6-pyruvoyl tetrahydropterin synthase [Nitzschia inconspicua]|uniref:6-pyruvoyl tetrahydropterin synthase n=1 Tax=Nitzschia inconspicua TaxID=303405 RepID=A0A9K3PQQ5_9STRA|nr:6-pyruvoyl tetrahydropterin synthase [Nitzschia inconspicua]